MIILEQRCSSGHFVSHDRFYKVISTDIPPDSLGRKYFCYVIPSGRDGRTAGADGGSAQPSRRMPEGANLMQDGEGFVSAKAQRRERKLVDVSYCLQRPAKGFPRKRLATDAVCNAAKSRNW
jgi:hypothetical protein